MKHEVQIPKANADKGGMCCFQELLEKGEQSVNQHQEYQDASNTFLNWLRGAREKLVTCSDTYGDKTAIIGKIDKAKVQTRVAFSVYNLLSPSDFANVC